MTQILEGVIAPHSEKPHVLLETTYNVAVRNTCGFRFIYPASKHKLKSHKPPINCTSNTAHILSLYFLDLDKLFSDAYSEYISLVFFNIQ